MTGNNPSELWREYVKDHIREAIFLAFRSVITRCSPMFWSYRGLNKAHWRLWRNAIRQLSNTRKQFRELADELGRDTPAGKKIWDLLTTK